MQKRTQGWEIARLRSLLEIPYSGWNLYVRLWREGDYLAARAARKERLSDLLILLVMREKGYRAPISPN